LRNGSRRMVDLRVTIYEVGQGRMLFLRLEIPKPTTEVQVKEIKSPGFNVPIARGRIEPDLTRIQFLNGTAKLRGEKVW